MPRSDLDRTERASKPLVNPRTRFLRIPANAVGGTAEDLSTDIGGLAGSGDVCGILLNNQGAVAAWLRGAAAGAGEGIEIPAGGNLYLGWDNPGAGVIFMENAGVVDVLAFRL